MHNHVHSTCRRLSASEASSLTSVRPAGPVVGPSSSSGHLHQVSSSATHVSFNKTMEEEMKMMVQQQQQQQGPSPDVIPQQGNKGSDANLEITIPNLAGRIFYRFMTVSITICNRVTNSTMYSRYSTYSM